jgi:hypothetical protein
MMKKERETHHTPQVKMIIDPTTKAPSFWKTISMSEYFSLLDQEVDEIVLKPRLNEVVI